VLLHPEDARHYRVREGEKIAVVNHRGRTLRVARITEGTRRGVVVAEGIYWPTADSPGINDLTSQKCSDLGGGATFHETLVTLVKLGEEMAL
jgi:anaerobic selenocysteine-containing dehydrogenase